MEAIIYRCCRCFWNQPIVSLHIAGVGDCTKRSARSDMQESHTADVSLTRLLISK